LYVNNLKPYNRLADKLAWRSLWRFANIVAAVGTAEVSRIAHLISKATHRRVIQTNGDELRREIWTLKAFFDVYKNMAELNAEI
jgi:hypothetical protein